MQDFEVLGSEGFFSFCTLLKVTTQSINSSISLALSIINLKIVSREFLDLTNLSRGQTPCVHKLLEVVVVSIYKDFILKLF